MGTAMGLAAAASVSHRRAWAADGSPARTLYIAAYDTESPACLPACRKIVAVHQRLEMPATFFITGRTLEAHAAEYKGLLSDPLFEVNLLKNHNGWGPRRLTLWPSPMPEAIPAGFVKTPDDEFQVNRISSKRPARGVCRTCH
jgi:peptidoglycan/xylan/chitin deacetylase (PgdA/CDA1 family)